jgi:hypothetical protein
MAWESRKRPRSASSERRARRSARRPRRRRKENPAAASRRPHRSDSARSRYMRRRSDSVGRLVIPACSASGGIAPSPPVSLNSRGVCGARHGRREAGFPSLPV